MGKGREFKTAALVEINSPDTSAVAESEIERRLRRSQETIAAVGRLRADPSPENAAALHRLHAAHLREDGDLDGAVEAEARADRAEAASWDPRVVWNG